MKKLLFVVAAAVMSLGSASLHASVVDYSFSFGGTATGSGILVTSTTATAGQYLVTGISGTVDGHAISALLPPNTYPPTAPPTNDNLFFNPGTPHLDVAGISF